MRQGIIVVDIGGTAVKIGSIQDGRIGAIESRTPASELMVSDPIVVLGALISRFATDRRLSDFSIVVSVPGSIARDCSQVIACPNLPSLDGRDLAGALSKVLGRPALLERDVNLLLLGEARAGAAAEAASTFGVFIGTGIGAALIRDGEPFRGHNGQAGEIGHVPIRGNGAMCPCGKRDCLEAYASGLILQRWAAEWAVPIGEVFIEASKRPEGQVRLAHFIQDISFVVAGAANLLDPECLLIGGGVVEMPSFPKEAMMAAITVQLHRSGSAAMRVTWPLLGASAAVYGGAALTDLNDRLTAHPSVNTN